MQRSGLSAAQAQPGPAPIYYSIDVECVATGTDHNTRAVGQISLVDQYEQVNMVPLCWEEVAHSLGEL